jgi:hypothetical protein
MRAVRDRRERTTAEGAPSSVRNALAVRCSAGRRVDHHGPPLCLPRCAARPDRPHLIDRDLAPASPVRGAAALQDKKIGSLPWPPAKDGRSDRPTKGDLDDAPAALTRRARDRRASPCRMPEHRRGALHGQPPLQAALAMLPARLVAEETGVSAARHRLYPVAAFRPAVSRVSAGKRQRDRIAARPAGAGIAPGPCDDSPPIHCQHPSRPPTGFETCGSGRNPWTCADDHNTQCRHAEIAATNTDADMRSRSRHATPTCAGSHQHGFETCGIGLSTRSGTCAHDPQTRNEDMRKLPRSRRDEDMRRAGRPHGTPICAGSHQHGLETCDIGPPTRSGTCADDPPTRNADMRKLP